MLRERTRVPLYEYECLDCGRRQEVIVRSDADVPSHCSECGSSRMDRVISAPGGYSMDSGPSSVRPRGAGSFRRK
jgi:putative FmdB family regulatory protein